MPSDADDTPWRDRLSRIADVVARKSGSRRAHNILLALSVAIFLVISIVSFTSLSDDVHIRWWAVPILILVTTPLTVLANSAEFRIMGLVNGHRIGWVDSARLTVIAGAANLLPLPGGVLIRTQALRNRGSTYRRALVANLAAGLTWIGCACLVIAALYTTADKSSVSGWLVVLLAAVGVAGLLATWQILNTTQRPEAGRLFAALVVVEAATVLVSGSRIYFAFKLIGLSATAAQSTALTAAQIIAAAVGIFPAGLGLREALAGLIGAMVNVGAGASIAASAADRVTAQLSLALLGVALLASGRLRREGAVDLDDEGQAVVPMHDTP